MTSESKQTKYWAAGMLVASVLSGCGGDDRPKAAEEGGGARPSAGVGGKSGGGGTGSGDGDAGEGGAPDGGDPLAPTVVITSPTPAMDPNSEAVLTGADVLVRCRAKGSSASGAASLNAASVKLAALDAAGKVVDEKAATLADDDEFEAQLSLLNLPTGWVTFRCSAEDTEKRAARTEIDTLLDQGPVIEFVQPVDMSAHALGTPLDVEFTVDEAKLTDDDDLAAVSKVALEIAGVEIDLDGAEDEPGHYRLQVNLNSPTFNPAPSGPLLLRAQASNGRKPKAITAQRDQNVTIDGSGPTIAIQGPLDKAVVGGNVLLRFTVNDPLSGVDQDTVEVTLNSVKYRYRAGDDRWSVANGTYTFEFDSRLVKDARVQITLNVGASDKVGNAATAVSELLYLDNYPPILDLDPLNIRTKARGSGRCSTSFDPVGSAAANDLDSAQLGRFFRTMVWDQTNSDAAFPTLHYAGVNRDSVRLYMQGDLTKPLLVSKATPGKGVCDDVAEPDSTDSIELDGVSPSHTPWYTTDGADVAPSAASLACAVEQNQGTQPKKLCTGEKSDMWQVVEDIYNQSPAVYAASVTPDLECNGVAWEFTGKLDKDGWVCFATRAVDAVGNVGISRPIRICVDKDNEEGTPPCANSSTTPPTCTDGCTPPARWGNVAVEIP